jgi:aminopeptidase YwaD
LITESNRFQSLNQIVPQSVTPRELTMQRYFPINTLADGMQPPTPAAGDGRLIFRRTAQPKGPLTVFGYDYFEVEWAKHGHAAKPKLLEYEGLWGAGEEYAYEVLNFADGNRTAQQIRDAVSAEYGPVPLNMVVEYLKALEEIDAVKE